MDSEDIARILEKCGAMEKAMSEADPSGSDYARLARDYAALRPVAETARALAQIHEEERALETMEREAGEDKEMMALAAEERKALRERREILEAEFKQSLASGGVEEDSAASVILEVRSGTGGEEAALFAGDLLRMYQRYAAARGWSVELMSLSESETGGAREAVASIAGEGAFSRLRFESGVHRVQRVPTTESSGRIHTSAATVAVLPEPQEREIHIEEKDLRIDVFRARGPGGQSVNTTDSAVRVTHIPSGIVVAQQDEKSQHRNRAKAMKVLRARLYEKMREEDRAARAETRRGQIGSGDRSERIRTYNFPQNRVSDHRIGLTLYKLEAIMDGDLDMLIDPLREAEAEDAAHV